jgi:hypothetical protein
MASSRLRSVLLSVAIGIAAAAAACGGGEGSEFQAPTDGRDAWAGDATLPGDDGSSFDFDSGLADGARSDAVAGLDVQPAALQTITVAIGQQTPTVPFTATLDGLPVDVGWTLDRGDLGAIAAGPSATSTFVPAGKTGGLVTILAGLNGQTIQRQVFVKLAGEQDGANASVPAEAAQIPGDAGALTAGGGVGGVGGEGLGPSVTDAPTKTALGAPAGDGSAQSLRLIYPYDRTVWPRGLLAPLLQWTWSVGDADAIKIDLATTSGSFTWSGTFARPAVLAQTGGKFVRHPIPQDVWDMATNTAGAATPSGQPDRLTVSLTVARGGAAYGPVQQIWAIAPARLAGTIYYNSYGTQLAQNYGGAVGGNGRFGGAVLSIRVGDTAPKLTAGGNGDATQCRVCHSVAANGSRLVVQRGDNYSASSAYDLSPSGSTEHALAIGAQFPGVYPDGSKALSPDTRLLPLTDGGTPAIPTTGLADYTRIGTPAFSPDGKLVAFNPVTASALADPTLKLIVMGYDNATNAFSNATVVVDDSGKPAGTRPGWAAFFPDGRSIAFHHQSVVGGDGNGDGNGALYTRKGAKAQIHWTSAADAAHVTPLNALNGLDATGASYLPKLDAPITMTCSADGQSVGSMDADHADDANLNYEPTVNPVASGGYAWVVFTSRRMYGSVADIPPYCSDPRGVDLIRHVTPKKLWVAAVDLNAAPGNDASHPAFYLPAQEILAGNSRAFWVLDPCRTDGQSCETGDQCCNGYCEPGSADAGLVCTNTPPDAQCSKPQERCTAPSDCCDRSNLCTNGFCSVSGPR